MNKICKDCKWFEPAPYTSPELQRAVYEHAKCNAPQNTAQSRTEALVGVPGGKRRWVFCKTNREDNWFWSLSLGTCGKRGRWFAAKEG